MIEIKGNYNTAIDNIDKVEGYSYTELIKVLNSNNTK